MQLGSSTVRARKTLGVLLTAMLLAGGDARASTAGGPPVIATRWLTWTRDASQEQLRGLFLFESSGRGLVNRILVECPGEGRMIVTETLDPVRGIDTVHVRDDHTGWWAVVEKRFQFRAESLWEYFNIAYEGLEPENGGAFDLRLDLLGELSFQAEVTVRKKPEGEHAEFVDELRAAELATQVAALIPLEIGRCLEFLQIAFSDRFEFGYNLKAPPDILVPFLIEPTAEAAGWVQSHTTLEKGLELSAPEDLSFVEQFTSIDPVRPLADHRLHHVITESSEIE